MMSSLVRRFRGQEAWALFVTMTTMYTTAMILLCTVTVVTFSARIVTLQAAHQQAYWLARGTAVQVLHQLQRGTVLQDYTVHQYDEGTVEVSAEHSDHCSVTVVAHTQAAAECISFVYDVQQQKVLDWKENLPVPASNHVQ